MKILVACEESQAVTVELRKLGHEAFSCDLKPCSGKNPEFHYQEDVFISVKRKNWDMIIAFPPCTHLAVSGAKHFEQKRIDGRQQEAVEFFMDIARLKINKIVIENPIGIMTNMYRKPDQIIHPWMFGDEYQKSTCLWLKNTNKLEPTKLVSKGEFFEFISKKGVKKRQPLWYYKAKNQKEDASFLRSKTFPGIAKAMAEQLTKPLKQQTLF